MIVMRRPFVIHVHSGHGQLHYDLMLCRGDALATWRLFQPPASIEIGQVAPARRLADHRIEYLDYEGPVSRGRGRVDRADRGGYELLDEEPARLELRLEGKITSGRYELLRSGPEDPSWTMRRLPDA